MATDNRLRDTASDYNDIYRNPDARFGIENPRVTRGGREQTLTSRPSEDGRRGRTTPRRYRGPQEQDELTEEMNRREQIINQRYINEVEQLPPLVKAAPSIRPHIKIRTGILARSRAVFFAFTCGSIVSFVAIIQALFLSLGFTMMGMASLSEESWTAWLAEKAAGITGWLVGFEYPDLMSMAAGSFLFSGLLGLICLFGFALFSVFLQLHPLYGNGASEKTTRFMIAIALSMVPFGSMPWILAVLRHPK